MTKGLTYLQAAALILKDIQRPMSAKELIDEIRKRRWIEFSGKTPLQSMNSRISRDIKKKKDQSLFKRVRRGKHILYILRELSNEEEYYAIPHRKRVSRLDKVLVFPTEKLNEIGHFHGIRKDFEVYEKVLLSPDTSYFISRLKAETDDKFKQIVSYVIVKYDDKLLRFTRGVITNIGEYLHGEYSIAFGGHVEESDSEPLFKKDSGYINSVKRELSQEINIKIDKLPKYNLQTIGVLNDDSTELGRHHFAFVQLLELFELPDNDDEFFKKGEKSINNPQLVEISELSKEFGGYEYWSKLCIQTFFSNRLSFECHIHPKPDFSIREHQETILIVGYIGSGKTEACNLLSKEFGYTMVPCSKILQKEIGCEPMTKIGRHKLQELGFNFISKKNGHKRLARAIVRYMKENPSEKYVLDGLRYTKTLDEMNKLIGKRVSVIYVESTIDNLFRYYLNKKYEDDKNRDFNQFLKIVYHPVEREIERFWPIADITIYNHGSKDGYLQKLQQFFREELTNDQSMGS